MQNAHPHLQRAWYEVPASSLKAAYGSITSLARIRRNSRCDRIHGRNNRHS